MSRKPYHRGAAARIVFLATLLSYPLPAVSAPAGPLIELGRSLFFDTRLSEPHGQACASCHDPQRAFSDPRAKGPDSAVSIGADGHSFGTRNTPGLTYIGLVPPFSRKGGLYQGGFFLDGRAPTLEAQAVEPLINPLEMALPDSTAIVTRVLENETYRAKLAALFGGHVLDDERIALKAITTAIAAFERSREFSRFDSRYDRYLTGDYVMTREEAIGREVFFSGLVNCIQCHLNQADRVSDRETFTNHRYHNIGVPANPALRGHGLGSPDPGLAAHPAVMNRAQSGRFRVPSLRNVAVTAPYMHNGVFADLETAVAFYGRFTLRHQRNPETGQPWREPETPDTVDVDILTGGQPIDPARIRHLTAFLKTLTDRRYEHLLD